MTAEAFDLESRIEALRAERGDKISIDEIAEIVSSVMEPLESDIRAVDLRVYKELDDLASYIHNAKSEIETLCPDDIRTEHLPAASDQLDAIVKATEEATGIILDASEKIDAEAHNLGARPIIDEVARIFEACSFQDLTGQRVSKVVATLKYIENRLDRFVDVFGEEVKRVRHKPAKIGCPPDEEGALLNGPQLPGDGNDQQEIDALLADFD
ncbi:MAG: protein phosphatase CheZ [Alphaproteobacteria bacterium]